MDVITREPVRAYLYSVVGAVVALLVGLGVVTAEVAPLILGVASAVLGVVGVEVARAKVMPVEKVKQRYGRYDVPCDGCPDADCGRCG